MYLIISYRESVVIQVKEENQELLDFKVKRAWLEVLDLMDQR